MDLSNIGTYATDAIQVAMCVITVASILCTVVPHPARLDTALGKFRSMLDLLSLNFGHATPQTAAMRNIMDAVADKGAVAVVANPATPGGVDVKKLAEQGK